MRSEEILKHLLKSYGTYYDINEENPTPPFAAEASFYSEGEHYFLIKNAKLAGEESNEHVFFYRGERLDTDTAMHLARAAWEAGLGRVHPHGSHRNTDITLVCVADEIEPGAFRAIKRLRFYKSYKLSFHGWSAFRAVALETETYKVVFNGRGAELKKFFMKFIKRCKSSDEKI